MKQMSLRNNRLRFETSGKILVTDEPVCLMYNRSRLETVGKILVTDDPCELEK